MDEPKEDYRDELGRFTSGNRFWETALNAFGSRGPAPEVQNAEELVQLAADYFEDITDRPLLEERAFAHEGRVTTHDSPRMRPMTIEGLCNHIGVTDRTWRRWRDTRDDLRPAIEFIEQIMFQQKFEGAASGLMNHQIIARHLGLADSTTTKVTGHDGGALLPDQDWTIMETARRLAFVLAEAVAKQKEQTIEHSETSQQPE